MEPSARRIIKKKVHVSRAAVSGWESQTAINSARDGSCDVKPP